jgi:hypothetical protein
MDQGDGDSLSGDGEGGGDPGAASPVPAPPARVYNFSKRKSNIGRYKGTGEKYKGSRAKHINNQNNDQAVMATPASVPSCLLSGAKRKWTTNDLKKEITSARRKLSAEISMREQQEKGRLKEQHKSKALGNRLRSCITEKRRVQLLLKDTEKRNRMTKKRSDVSMFLVLIIIIQSHSNKLLGIFEQIAIDKLQTRMDKESAARDKSKQVDLNKLSAWKNKECNTKLAALTRKHNKKTYVLLSNHKQQLNVCLLILVCHLLCIVSFHVPLSHCLLIVSHTTVFHRIVL